MAIGPFRDVPAEMDDVEARVAAAQYPEGALVAGVGVGTVVPLLLAPSLAPVGAILCGLLGFAGGRWYQERKVRRHRARD